MEYNLSCNSYYEDEEFYWFAEIQYNGFYKVDKQTLKPELLFHFPEEALDQELLFSQILKMGDWFVFSPERAKQIVLYHAITQEIKTIPLAAVQGEKKIKYNPDLKFSAMASLEGKVYFFPFSYPAIVVLDLEDMTVDYVTNWVDQLENGVEEHRNSVLNSYFRSALVEGEKVYLPSACSNQLVIFDLKNHQVDCVSISAQEQGFNGIAFDGNHFWLTPLFGREIVKWSREGSELVSLAKNTQGLNEIRKPFVYQKRLFLLAGFQNQTYEVNIVTHQVKVNEALSQQVPQKQQLHTRTAFMIMASYFVGETLHFICGNDRNWYVYDLEKEVLTKKVIPMDEVGVEILKQRSVVRLETPSAHLMDFCHFVIEMEQDGTGKKTEMTVGEKILKATV